MQQYSEILKDAMELNKKYLQEGFELSKKHFKNLSEQNENFYKSFSKEYFANICKYNYEKMRENFTMMMKSFQEVSNTLNPVKN